MKYKKYKKKIRKKNKKKKMADIKKDIQKYKGHSENR